MTTTQINGGEACNYNGVTYCAVYVSPRGFSNEAFTCVVRADDPIRVALLQREVDRAANRQVGDSYRANWLTAQEISQHIYSQRNRTGIIHLLTVDEDGNRDAFEA